MSQHSRVSKTSSKTPVQRTWNKMEPRPFPTQSAANVQSDTDPAAFADMGNFTGMSFYGAPPIQRQEEEPEDTAPETIQAKCSECEAESPEPTVQRREEEEEFSDESVPVQRMAEEFSEDETPLQAKLSVGKPGDKYEQEADNMAARVMAMSDPSVPQEEMDGETVQAKSLAGEVTPLVQRRQIQRKGNKDASPSIERQLSDRGGGGRPLADGTRSFMESRFGADFSGVRVHTDSAAVQMTKSLGAQAFTHGQDIYYGKGKSPGKNDLTAHELTHTIQQTGGEVKAKSVDSLETKKENKIQAKAVPAIQRREAPPAESEGETPAVPVAAPSTEGEASPVPAAKEEGTAAPQVETGKGSAAIPETTTENNGTALVESGGNAPVAAPSKTNSDPVSPGSGGGMKAPTSPEADPGFQAVVTQSEGVAEEKKQHEPAQSESQEAQDAAESPANEVESKAQDKQVGEMQQQEPGTFNGESFKNQILEQLKSVMPNNEDEAERFKESNQVDTVRNSISSQVSDEQERAAAPIEEKAEETPDTSSFEPRQAIPMELPEPEALPGAIDGTQAAPKPKSEGEVSAPLQANSQELDRQMAEADVTEEQLANSNEPTFVEALGAKKEAQTDAQTAPGTYRQSEQGILSSAQSGAQTTVETQTQGMHGQREQLLAQVTGLQEKTTGKDEQKRSEVANHINGIYERVKSDVDTSLDGLESEVTSKFESAANHAKQVFEDYVGGKMEAYKKKRYGEGWDALRVDKLGKRIHEAFTGLPEEVNQFFVDGRQKYIDEMDAPLTEIAELVAQRLNDAKQKIADGRQEIQDYVQGLPEDLKQVGQEAAQNIQGKFDELEQSVESKQDELVNTITQKYRENLQAVDARIEEMKEQNKGLFDKAKDMMSNQIQTIMEMKSMLEGVLAGAMGAVGKIIKDPIGFLGNLVTGLKQGFNNFVTNIGTHLQGGLIAWLTGAMGGIGIQIPEDVFSLKGIFDLVTQILGLTWNYIRGKATKMFGEPVVAAMEQGSEMFQVLRDNGPAGLWEHVQDQFADLKESVMGQIQEMVKSQVIESGITWILSLLTPAGAFGRAVKMIIDIVRFFIDRGSQVVSLVQAVMQSITAIADGSLGAAAKFIEDSLAKSLPVVIGFLASLAGVSGLAKKVQTIVGNIRERIDKAIEFLLQKAKKAAGRLLKKLGIKGEDEEDNDSTHKSLANQAKAELENTSKNTKDYQTLRQEKVSQAKEIESAYTAKLKQGIKLRVKFEDSSKDEKDGDLDFQVVIAPNDTVVDGSVPIDNNLKKAVKSIGILTFMKAMAAGQKIMEIDRAKLENLWNNQNNKDWLKDKFRSANSGHHEWIPSNMILQVINRAAGVEDGVQVANWIDLQHELRTDTSWVIFKPSKGTKEQYQGQDYTVLHGHIGAIYLNGKQKTKGTQSFHNSLRNSFSTSKTSSQCITELQKIFNNWVWDGKEAVNPSIHPQLKWNGIIVEKNLPDIKSKQSNNFQETHNMFNTLKNKYGN